MLLGPSLATSLNSNDDGGADDDDDDDDDDDYSMTKMLEARCFPHHCKPTTFADFPVCNYCRLPDGLGVPASCRKVLPGRVPAGGLVHCSGYLSAVRSSLSPCRR